MISRRAQLSGFTLIEFVVYFTLLGIMLGAITMLVWNINRDKIKLQAIHEVTQNARVVLETFSDRVARAEIIESPGTGNDGDYLRLGMYDPSVDPVEFNVDDGFLYYRENGDTYIPLTTDEVIISDVVFTNASLAEGFGAVRLEFTLSYNSQSSAREYQYSQDFSLTSTLRPQQ